MRHRFNGRSDDFNPCVNNVMNFRLGRLNIETGRQED